MKKQTTLLIIDSNQAHHEEWKNRLAGMPFKCTVTGTIRNGFAHLEKGHHSIVLIDALQEELPFPDLMKVFMKRYAETAVIAVTMVSDDKAMAELLREGIDEVLPYGVDNQNLKCMLERTLERHRLSVVNRVRRNMLERENRKYVREIETLKQQYDQNFVDTVKTFVGLLDTRDHHLGSHCKRVATFSRAVAEHYDLTDRVRHEIELAALLHDIGKIGIPDQLLAKSRDYFKLNQLTRKEQQFIEKHPVMGQEAIEMIDMTQHLGLYIRHHHERFDGNGYPDKLKGFLIPLGSRIINVVDAYDRIVMMADTQNRQAARELFFKFLRKHTGTLFDPEAAKYLVQVLRELESLKYEQQHRVNIDSLTPGMVLARDVITKTGVLLISQYERLTAKDINRLVHFTEQNTIMPGVFVYGSDEPLKKPAAKDSAKPQEKLEDVNFEKVCSKIDTAKDLGTLPIVYESVLKCLSDPKSTREDLAEVIKRDQVVVLKILRIVNSPLFGFSRSITTLEDAIPLLGFNEIRNIVTSLAVLRMFNEGNSPDVFDRNEFWKHSIGCAIVARIVAEKVGADYPEEYFTAGLVHDIGKLVLDQLYPAQFREVIRLVKEKSIFMRKAERTVFGRPHQEFGAYLLQKWNLPDMLIDVVKHHHSPVDSTVDPQMASAVHLADIITHMLQIGASGERSVPKFETFAARQLNINISDFETLVPEIDEQVKQSSDLLSL